jgi:hypothetical protein
MVQVPEVNEVTLLPDTVHTVVVEEAKFTGRAELAVAERVSEAPAASAGIAAKAIVYDSCETVTLWETGVATL